MVFRHMEGCIFHYFSFRHLCCLPSSSCPFWTSITQFSTSSLSWFPIAILLGLVLCGFWISAFHNLLFLPMPFFGGAYNFYSNNSIPNEFFPPRNFCNTFRCLSCETFPRLWSILQQAFLEWVLAMISWELEYLTFLLSLLSEHF